jgi:PAS domain S-box-containing protein
MSDATFSIHAFDWGTTPLGPRTAWPAALVTIHDVMLASPFPMCAAWGPELTLLYNDAYADFLATRHPAALGRPIREVWYDVWADIHPLIERAMAGEEVHFTDLHLVMTRKGYAEDTYWTFAYSPLRDGGVTSGFLNIANETTEGVRANQRRDAAETELRLVTDALPFLVSFIDRSLTYRFANAAYEEWFGRPLDQVIGRTVPEVAGEEGYRLRRAMIERALAGEPARMDLDWPWPDGRRRITDIRYLPRRDAKGVVDGFYVFSQDVTALRDAAAVLSARAESSAREAAERTAEMNHLWNISPDLLLIIDFEGVFRRVNPAWTTLLGYAPEELVGHHVNEFVVPDDHAETVDAYELAAEGGLPRIVNRYRHKDGSLRWISWVAAPSGAVTYATGRDITAERERADALRQAEESLRQSQKMEAVGQLTGGVAHDFNNLLTIIRSSVDFLRRPDLPDARKDRYLNAVSETVERAAKLTGQLLAFARRQALKPEVFDVGQKVRGTAEMLDTVTGARVRVVAEVPDCPCFVRADLSQFETALINMAVNARDAMEGEGTLTLRLSCNTVLPAIRGHAGSGKAFAAVSLTDTGTGIPADQLARIFEPFFTTKEVGKGTGLGLSQVFGFAKQSGGDVDVVSAAGEGTTFTLYLPEVEPEEEPARGLQRDGDLVPLGTGQRILVVEDNIGVGQFATQILEDLGYRPTWAANAEEALDNLGDDGNGFELVFSDVVMPGMGGIALARMLKRRLPRLPVVLASGYSHVLAEEGTHGFELLHKPYSAVQLGRTLQQVLGPPSELPPP